MDFRIFLDVGLLLSLFRRVNRLLPPEDDDAGTDGADSGNSISAYTGKWSEKRIPPFYHILCYHHMSNIL